MTDNQSFKLGKNGASIDFSKIKTSIKKEDIEADEKMLELFNACDTNKNGELDLEEVSMFSNKVAQFAGDDGIFSKKEAANFIKQSAAEGDKKSSVKSNDLFKFINKLQTLGETKGVESPETPVAQTAQKEAQKAEGKDESNVKTTYVYNEDGTSTATQVKDNIKVISQLDKDGKVLSSEATEYDRGVPVASITVNEDGSVVETAYKDGKKSATLETTIDGVKTYTTYNENGRKTSATQQDVEGNVKKVEYDGKGSTYVVVQNGEVPAQLAKNFDVTVQELAQNNKGVIKKSENGTYYFLAGAKAKIPGELAPDHAGLEGRGSQEEQVQAYRQQENERIIEKIQGRPIKEVQVAKDYTSFTELAKDILKQEGVEAPTNQQITDRANVLSLLNKSSSLKQGQKVILDMTDAEIKQKAAQDAEFQKQVNLARDLKAKAERKEAMTQEGHDIADTMHKVISGFRVGSLNSEEFRSALKKVSPDNVLEVLREYEKISKSANENESLFEAVSDEILVAGGKTIRSMVQKDLIKKLIVRAEHEGVEPSIIEHYKQKMNSTADKAFSDEEMDYLANGLMQAIENLESLTSTQIQEARSQSFEDKKSAVVKMYDTVVSDAQRSFERQQSRDGWAAKTGEAFCSLFGSKNIDHLVKADIDAAKQMKAQLDNCKTEEEFKAKFKEIYGVDYDPAQMKVYENKRQEYLQASNAVASEQSFNNVMKEFLSNPELKNRTVYIPGGEGFGDRVEETASKEEVYAREVKTLATFLGDGDEAKGEVQLNEMLKQAGLENASADDKYRFMVNFVKTSSENLTKAKEKVLNGKTFEQITKEYNASYNAAFGTENDIAKRVREYNDSQEAAANFVKSGAKIALATIATAVTAGSGTPLLYAALLTSAASMTVDISDRVSSDDGITKEEYKAAVRDGLIDGFSMAASGFAGKTLRASNATTLARYGVQATVDTTTGAVSEYLRTGEVTVSNTVMNLGFSIAGTYFGDKLEAIQKEKAERRSQSWGLNQQELEVRNLDIDIINDAAVVSSLKQNEALPSNVKWTETATQSFDGLEVKVYKNESGRTMVRLKTTDSDIASQLSKGNLPTQFEKVASYIDELSITSVKAEGAKKVILTGTGSGGTMAELLAARSKSVSSVTFNSHAGSAQIADKAGFKRRSNSVNFVVEDNHAAVGEAKSHNGRTVVVDATTNDSYSMNNFVSKDGNTSLLTVQGGQADIATTREAKIRASRASRGSTLETALSSDPNGNVQWSKRKFNTILDQFKVDVNNINANLDELQAQVNKVKNVAQRNELQKVIDARREVLNVKANLSDPSKFKKFQLTDPENNNIVVTNGDQVNAYLKSNKGYKEPAFKPGSSEIRTMELTQETRFARVFCETGDPASFARGSWLIAVEDIQGLTPAQIKDKFALPGMPSHVVEVDLPVGTQIISGECNPVEKWGKGGGMQYFVTSTPGKPKYLNIKELPKQ